MVMGIFALSFYTAQNIDAYDLSCVFCFRVVFFLRERKLSCRINVDQFTFYIGVFLHYWCLLTGAFKWSILPWKKIPLETWPHHLRATHANGEHWTWQLCPPLPVTQEWCVGSSHPESPQASLSWHIFLQHQQLVESPESIHSQMSNSNINWTIYTSHVYTDISNMAWGLWESYFFWLHVCMCDNLLVV